MILSKSRRQSNLGAIYKSKIYVIYRQGSFTEKNFVIKKERKSKIFSEIKPQEVALEEKVITKESKIITNIIPQHKKIRKKNFCMCNYSRISHSFAVLTR